VNTLNERIADLIQADVDGALAEFDRAELDAALENSSDARAFRNEMLQLAGILNSTPELDPPAGLNRRILDSIELPSPLRLPAWLKKWFQPVSYSLAVAAGMLITVGMMKILPVSDVEMSSLVGSMVQQAEVMPDTSRGQLGVDVEAVRGSILLKELDGALAMQFELDSEEPVDISISLAQAGLSFGGFAHDTNSGETDGLSVLEVSDGNVRVRNQGAQQFVVFLRSDPGSKSGVNDLGVTISQNELQIFKDSISFGR